jgi:hypothetical protein
MHDAAPSASTLRNPIAIAAACRLGAEGERAPPPARLSVAIADGVAEVDTGAVRFRIDTRRFRLLDSARIDGIELLGALPDARSALESGAFWPSAPIDRGRAAKLEATCDIAVEARGASAETIITRWEAIDEFGWRHFGDTFADNERAPEAITNAAGASSTRPSTSSRAITCR